jgi:hypothetical protein
MAEVTIPSPPAAIRLSASAAPGAATVTNITGRITRLDGKPSVFSADLWLADAASGAGLTAVTATGAVALTTGLITDTRLAKKDFRFQTDATGRFVLQITDTAKTPFVIVVAFGGAAYPVLTLATANYG